MIRRGALAVLFGLASSPAWAGLCAPIPEGLRCADGVGPLILKGVRSPDGGTIMLTGNARGGNVGMVGSEKLVIYRSEDLTVVKIGNRTLACITVDSGITICK